jgi:hypothetical protein
MWIVLRVWECVFGIRCEEETKEGKGPLLRKGPLGKKGRKSLPERRGGLEELGKLALEGLGWGGKGRSVRRGFVSTIWIKS